MKKNQVEMEILKSYIPIVDFLSKVLGKKSEIVLHDLINQKILAISKNTITNRKIGDSISEVAKKVLELNENDFFSVNNIDNTFNGKDFRSNTYFIRNHFGEKIGMLCLNIDISIAIECKEFLQELIGRDDEEKTTLKLFHNASIEEYTLALINEVLLQKNIPTERMNVEEKKDVIKELNEKGIFRIKGSVLETSKRLDVSEATIYRYLKEIK